MFEFIYDILGVPFGFVLRFFYDTIAFENYGLAIIALTIFARILMIPSSISQQKGMAKTQRMQAKLRKIQTKYAGNQQKIQEETTALYQREGVNPMGAGCAPMLVQFIPLFGLLGAIYYPLSHFLYSNEISKEQIEALINGLVTEAESLGLKNVSDKSIYRELYAVMNIENLTKYLIDSGNITKDILFVNIDDINLDFIKVGNYSINLGDVFYQKDAAGETVINWSLLPVPVCSFLSSMLSGIYSMIKQKKNSNSPAPGGAFMTGCMTFGLPIFSLIWVVTLPAAIGVYWTVSSLCGFISQVILGYFYSPKKVMAKLMVEETIERRSKENHIKSITEIKEKKN